MTKRLRDGRAPDRHSAVKAALKLKWHRNIYIYPTAYGYAITEKKPPVGLQHLIVHPEGTVTHAANPLLAELKKLREEETDAAA